MKNFFIIFVVFITGLIITKMLRTNISGLLKVFKIRVDGGGNGHFGASRGNGTRNHMGVDASVQENEPIYAPFDLQFERKAFPYADDLSYQGAKYKFQNGFLKIFYFNPITNKSHFKKGDIIGYAQDISKKYGAPMTNHIHIELYNNNNEVLNPEKYV